MEDFESLFILNDVALLLAARGFVIGNDGFDTGIGHAKAEDIVSVGEDGFFPVVGVELTTESFS